MRVLFLSTWFPYPPNNGSKQRAYYLLQGLARKHEVTLLTFAHDATPDAVQHLTSCCKRIIPVAVDPFQVNKTASWRGTLSLSPKSAVLTYHEEMASTVKETLDRGSYAVVVAAQPGIARYLMGYTRTPMVLDEMDIALVRNAYKDTPPGLAKLRRGLTYWKTRHFARSIMAHFDVATVVSSLEMDLTSPIAPKNLPIVVIPNGVDTAFNAPSDDLPEPNTVIFTGAVTYKVNFDAVQWFVTAIWPLVLGQVSQAVFTVTGSTGGVDVAQLAEAPGVRYSGYLEDIRPVVRGSWACVVPLLQGGGTRLKILEAMALGTPVISTSKGVEGLDVTPGLNILLADDANSFAMQVVRLLGDQALRQRLAEEGRKLVQKSYDWRAIQDEFNQLVETVGRGKGGMHRG